eukprot:1031099-Rhodomonas_salina.1
MARHPLSQSNTLIRECRMRMRSATTQTLRGLPAILNHDSRTLNPKLQATMCHSPAMHRAGPSQHLPSGQLRRKVSTGHAIALL